MELLRPSPPPPSAAAAAAICRVFDPASPRPGPDDGPDAIVHVAVGRSPEKTAALLQWTFRQFGCRQVRLVHVHQPSPLIPTLLGKLPATQANEKSVSAYRREERKETMEILGSYLNICSRAQVQANFIMTEAGNIQKGIVDLVTMHSIQKLVVGTTPENCFKVKGISRKASYTVKNAPAFCEIWFVSKGKHVWTREASKVSDSWLNNSILREIIRPSALPSENSECILDSECFSTGYITKTAWQRGGNRDLSELNNAELVLPMIASSISHSQINSQILTYSNSTESWHTSPSERRISSDNSYWEKQELGGTYNRLEEAPMEVEESKIKGFAELVKRRKLEAEIIEQFNSAKASEAAYARETKFRDELEGLVKTTRMQQEELVRQRHEAMRELQNAMRKIDTLTDQAREMAHRRDEAAGELELIQSSIETLQVERKKIQQHRDETIHQFENWRSSHGTSAYCSKLVGFGNDEFNFTEFTLSDLETATCWFSESFKLGQGGYGTVYKGEVLNRTVVIKKLHPHNVQSEVEFQQEVCMLSKLRHPHLVTLIGVCSEALSLVYEYLPNGTLQDRLISRTTILPLNWKVRMRIAAEISSALLFLHSSKPEKIIHGDLKLGNIFLDSNFNCKIGDLGICHLVPEDTTHYPLFLHNTEPKGVFPYTDPEYQRTGVLTPKSDVYSFGIIILQLLTGKSPLGLANKVRRALLDGKLSSVLDMTAGAWPSDVATRLAEFGLQCSKVNCRDRPDLTPEVVRELKQLHTMKERPVPSFFLCPILQEIMHDPQVAADGFTYEGSALRGWLANGRETSPMTNLKLDHLNLTPNHALRYAIQDWLCQPN